MFWKKKTVDVELATDRDDKRDAFRIRPDSNQPIILKIAGASYYLVNISGTGCCFRSHQYKEGARVSGTITLPKEDLVFPVSLKIVSVKRDLCHCVFVKISPAAQDHIHGYVLELQKRHIRGRGR